MKKNIRLLFLGINCLFLLITSCRNNSIKSYQLDNSKFDTIIDGKSTGLYQITNKNGVSAAFTNFGGRIISLVVPDKDGNMTDVVTGFSSVKQYIEATEPYFGATIGRYGNRIAKGRFRIDGIVYEGSVNNNGNMLHGGTKGFQYVVWDAEKLDDTTLQFTCLSADGEMGFPGNLNVKVIYQLTDDNALKIIYEATTDKKTAVNLTNHAFFNLNGEGNGTILNHQLQVFANEYTPVDSTLIPTGELQSVKNTPFDFINLQAIGKRIDDDNEQLKNGKGYDHNFVLDKRPDKHAAKVIGEKSGIVMDVYTDQPGLQFYSGNFMKGNNIFKNGTADDYRTAFCLETQHFPDSPNQKDFPSTILNPGEVYNTVSEYKFSTIK